jgi:ABC-type transport system substrate-binding protein
MVTLKRIAPIFPVRDLSASLEHYQRLGFHFNPLNNWSAFHDPTYSALATAITIEVDPSRQQQVYGQWRDFVLDQSFSMPLAQSLPRTVVSANVHDLKYSMAEMLKATDAWLG